MIANNIHVFNPLARDLRRVFHSEIRKRKGRPPA